MSFYSALVLAANEGVREPSPTVIKSLLGELGLLHSLNAASDFGNLAEDVSALFDDEQARSENEYFFCPDSIGLNTGIEIMSPEDDYSGTGWSLCIHGNGYFFPWDVAALRERVIFVPKLRRLSAALQEQFGGRFVTPLGAEPLLRARLIEGKDGWVWFASESL